MPVLLKTQKNQIYQEISLQGMSATDFQWTDDFVQGKPSELITHLDSGFFFEIWVDLGQNCGFSPGRETIEQTVHTGDWVSTYHELAQWMYRLREEITAPDLWGRVEGYRFIEGGQLKDKVNNDRLSEQHIDDIHAAMAALRDQIAGEAKITEEMLREIDKRLQYLTDAADRLGRFDWINVASSIVQGVIINATVDTERGKRLWEFFWGFLRTRIQIPTI
jgi:hypothetical protein